MEKRFKSKHGRPTKQKQRDIERALRPLYEGTISSSVAARETGHNIKTILKYYNKWNEEILEPEKKDFLKRCRDEKERSVLALDNLMLSLNKEFDNNDKTIRMMKETGDYILAEKYIKLKIKLADKILKLVTTKLSITNSPTYDSMIEIRKQVDVN